MANVIYLPTSSTLQSASTPTNQPGHDFLHRVIAVFTGSPEQSIIVNGSGYVVLANVPSYANNAAALAGGLGVGTLYRNGDALQVVH